MEPIGERLSGRREELGLTLREAETATRIRLRYLQAIEDDRFDELPGDVFAKGFLRAYATYLGLDGDAIVEDFKTLRPSTDHMAAIVPDASVARGRGRRRRRRSGRRFGLPLLLVLLAAAGVALVHMRSLSGPAPARSGSSTSLPAGAAAPAAAPQTTASPAAASSTATPARPRFVAGTPQGTVLPYTVTGAAALDVRATFTGPCWVRVWIDGVRQHPDQTYQRGQSAAWHARNNLRILLGNPPQVKLAVGGATLGPIQSANPRTVSLTLAKA